MKNTRRGLVALVFTLLVFMGIGYAAINNQIINITGTASTADASFSVVFDTEHNAVSTVEKSAGVTATPAYVSTASATFDVTGLKEKGDYAEAVFKVNNESTSLSASVTASVSSQFTDSDYLDATVSYGKSATGEFNNTPVVVEPDGSMYVKVRVTLKKSSTEPLTAKAYSVTVTGTPTETN